MPRAKRPPQVGTIASTIMDRLYLTILCDVRERHHSHTLILRSSLASLGPTIASPIAPSGPNSWCGLGRSIPAGWALNFSNTFEFFGI